MTVFKNCSYLFSLIPGSVTSLNGISQDFLKIYHDLNLPKMLPYPFLQTLIPPTVISINPSPNPCGSSIICLWQELIFYLALTTWQDMHHYMLNESSLLQLRHVSNISIVLLSQIRNTLKQTDLPKIKKQEVNSRHSSK